MPVKRRKLSPSASSASSTPAPPSVSQSQSGDIDTSTLSSSFTAVEGLAGPGPSTLSHQSQSRRERNDAAERREFARLGAQVPGSGDGDEYGEECFLWTDVPIVKNFRYAPCAISPTPSPHPRFPFHRTIPYPPTLPSVHMSWLDRSSYIRISPSGLTISNDRGFRSARANVSVREGKWYFEVKIERGNGDTGGGKGHLSNPDHGNAHVRIGWGRRESGIDSPVGSDAYSYSIRDVNGEKVHLARPKPYSAVEAGAGAGAGKSFKTGDIIGCLITLPSRPSSNNLPRNDPGKIKRHRRQFIYKGQSYFESPEYMPSKEMDSLIDREGKLLAEKKAAEKEALNKLENPGGNDNDQSENVTGNVSGPKKTGGGSGKKGATTKNTKKKKDEPIQQEIKTNMSRPLERLEGSKIEFYLNGENLGIAFEDIYDFIPLPSIQHFTLAGKKSHYEEDDVMHDDGTLGYYPMISCFGKGKATFNPGPNFIYPPEQAMTNLSNENGQNISQKIRPICERWEEFKAEEKGYDEKDEIEGTERLKELLEEEEKQRIKASLTSNSSGKRKKGGTGIITGKKKKVDITESVRGNSVSASNSRGNTMTPQPEDHSIMSGRGNTSTPGLDDVKLEQERDRSDSVTPSLMNSVPPTRGSSPNTNKIYSEIAEQQVVEDTPKSPQLVEDNVKIENGNDVETKSVVDFEQNVTGENVRLGSSDDENEGVDW
ncbi:uncharacterized protein L201_004536 [Kwoniella dendrophila CBS 6074]|uniref:B30.2/SPRY domain-containing protein n=1 Tax=Kwoniella dendrophila CBS 6074 TaxID=1295534 RepID=A0AAX4JW46_9TREE